QIARPGLPIALPVERIGLLMDCDWTQVRRWRQRAVCAEQLRPVEPYVPHRRAGQYLYLGRRSEANSIQEKSPAPTRSVPLALPTSGLVGHFLDSSSGTRSIVRAETHHSPLVGRVGSSAKCYIHGTHTEWWYRPEGDAVCNRCHPN